MSLDTQSDGIGLRLEVVSDRYPRTLQGSRKHSETKSDFTSVPIIEVVS